ncbi:MAG TPA: sigma-70 family RNA polymerase sigma factor [Thermoanaerobaculia bacterium]|nr:sigma-70 family RNA polymerase sigma factor [Thermoanaerobaculia bacterium]
MADDRDDRFEKLYEYYPAVVSLLRKLDFELDDARDLAHEVFLRVFQSMDAYRGESKWSYLETVTRRLAYNEIRNRHAAKRNGLHVATEEILELDDSRTLAPDEALRQKESAGRLYDAIRQLNADEQKLILLQLSGASYEDIVSLTGLKLSAVKSRLHVIRKRLRELLGEDVEGIGGGDDQ